MASIRASERAYPFGCTNPRKGFTLKSGEPPITFLIGKAARRTLLAILLVTSLPLRSADWTTFAGNAQRDGWNREKSSLTPASVKSLKLKWNVKLDSAPKELSALTAPVLRTNVATASGIKDILIVGGARDKAFALDAKTGKLLWNRTLPTDKKPPEETHWLCPYTQNATPAIVGNTAYFLASDGRLTGLNVANGDSVLAQQSFIHRFGKTWSLNVAGDTLYTATSQQCNGVWSAVYAIDLKGFFHTVNSFNTAPKGGAGMWGRAGVALASDGSVFAETGDGPNDPAKGRFADSFIKLSAHDLKLLDYYTPTNREYLTKKDLDMGSMSPIIFPFEGRELVAGAGKEGVIYLLDAKKPGGDDHHTPLFRSPLYSNQDAEMTAKGFWGNLSAARDSSGTQWLLAPSWGAPAQQAPTFAIQNGPSPDGSVMAFKVEMKGNAPVLTPAWKSRNMRLPEPVVIHNGMVFALASGESGISTAKDRNLSSKERISLMAGNAVLYVLDLKTGKELFSSGGSIKGFTHFSAPVVSNGMVYVVNYNSTVYAFGLN